MRRKTDSVLISSPDPGGISVFPNRHIEDMYELYSKKSDQSRVPTLFYTHPYYLPYFEGIPGWHNYGKPRFGSAAWMTLGRFQWSNDSYNAHKKPICFLDFLRFALLNAKGLPPIDVLSYEDSSIEVDERVTEDGDPVQADFVSTSRVDDHFFLQNIISSLIQSLPEPTNPSPSVTDPDFTSSKWFSYSMYQNDSKHCTISDDVVLVVVPAARVAFQDERRVFGTDEYTNRIAKPVLREHPNAILIYVHEDEYRPEDNTEEHSPFEQRNRMSQILARVKWVDKEIAANNVKLGRYTSHSFEQDWKTQEALDVEKAALIKQYRDTRVKMMHGPIHLTWPLNPYNHCRRDNLNYFLMQNRKEIRKLAELCVRLQRFAVKQRAQGTLQEHHRIPKELSAVIGDFVYFDDEWDNSMIVDGRVQDVQDDSGSEEEEEEQEEQKEPLPPIDSFFEPKSHKRLRFD